MCWGVWVWKLLPIVFYKLLKSSANLRFLKSWECFFLCYWWMLSLDRVLKGGRKKISLTIVKFSFSWCLFIPGNKLCFKQHFCLLLFPRYSSLLAQKPSTAVRFSLASCCWLGHRMETFISWMWGIQGESPFVCMM